MAPYPPLRLLVLCVLVTLAIFSKTAQAFPINSRSTVADSVTDSSHSHHQSSHLVEAERHSPSARDFLEKTKNALSNIACMGSCIAKQVGPTPSPVQRPSDPPRHIAPSPQRIERIPSSRIVARPVVIGGSSTSGNSPQRTTSSQTKGKAIQLSVTSDSNKVKGKGKAPMQEVDSSSSSTSSSPERPLLSKHPGAGSSGTKPHGE